MVRAYLCVSIDTECDKGPKWRCQKPMAFEGVVRGVAARLQPLFAAYRAKPTYLVSPEVLRHEPSVEVLRSLRDGAELGAHLHGEYADPGAFEPDVTSVFQRDYPESVERAKLTNLTESFARALGAPPRSFRAGRFGIGPHTIPILESLGYAVESSVTPHVDWSSAGAKGLSFVGAATQPYRPDRRDAARPGTADLLEVPVTIRPRAANRLPLVGRLVEPRWLRPTHGTARRIVRVARDEIRDAARRSADRPIILNAMFHNVEVIPGASPYAADEDGAEGILARLRALLTFAAGEAIPVVGLADVPEILAT